MNSRHFIIIASIAPALLLCGCENMPREQSGTAVGAVTGGLLGSQIGQGSGRTAATIVGAVAGGAVGNAVGRNMDENDRMRTAQALETAPVGSPTAWRNPDSGDQFTVVPTRSFQTAEGPCREYTMDTVIGNRPQQVFGTACRQPDGSWQARN